MLDDESVRTVQTAQISCAECLRRIAPADRATHQAAELDKCLRQQNVRAQLWAYVVVGAAAELLRSPWIKQQNAVTRRNLFSVVSSFTERELSQSRSDSSPTSMFWSGDEGLCRNLVTVVVDALVDVWSEIRKHMSRRLRVLLQRLPTDFRDALSTTLLTVSERDVSSPSWQSLEGSLLGLRLCAERRGDAERSVTGEQATTDATGDGMAGNSVQTLSSAAATSKASATTTTTTTTTNTETAATAAATAAATEPPTSLDKDSSRAFAVAFRALAHEQPRVRSSAQELIVVWFRTMDTPTRTSTTLRVLNAMQELAASDNENGSDAHSFELDGYLGLVMKLESNFESFVLGGQRTEMLKACELCLSHKASTVRQLASLCLQRAWCKGNTSSSHGKDPPKVSWTVACAILRHLPPQPVKSPASPDVPSQPTQPFQCPERTVPGNAQKEPVWLASPSNRPTEGKTQQRLERTSPISLGMGASTPQGDTDLDTTESFPVQQLAESPDPSERGASPNHAAGWEFCEGRVMVYDLLLNDLLNEYLAAGSVQQSRTAFARLCRQRHKRSRDAAERDGMSHADSFSRADALLATASPASTSARPPDDNAASGAQAVVAGAAAASSTTSGERITASNSPPTPGADADWPDFDMDEFMSNLYSELEPLVASVQYELRRIAGQVITSFARVLCWYDIGFLPLHWGRLAQHLRRHQYNVLLGVTRGVVRHAQNLLELVRETQLTSASGASTPHSGSHGNGGPALAIPSAQQQQGTDTSGSSSDERRPALHDAVAASTRTFRLLPSSLSFLQPPLSHAGGDARSPRTYALDSVSPSSYLKADGSPATASRLVQLQGAASGQAAVSAGAATAAATTGPSGVGALDHSAFSMRGVGSLARMETRIEFGVAIDTRWGSASEGIEDGASASLYREALQKVVRDTPDDVLRVLHSTQRVLTALLPHIVRIGFTAECSGIVSAALVDVLIMMRCFSARASASDGGPGGAAPVGMTPRVFSPDVHDERDADQHYSFGSQAGEDENDDGDAVGVAHATGHGGGAGTSALAGTGTIAHHVADHASHEVGVEPRDIRPSSAVSPIPPLPPVPRSYSPLTFARTSPAAEELDAAVASSVSPTNTNTAQYMDYVVVLRHLLLIVGEGFPEQDGPNIRLAEELLGTPLGPVATLLTALTCTGISLVQFSPRKAGHISERHRKGLLLSKILRAQLCRMLPRFLFNVPVQYALGYAVVLLHWLSESKSESTQSIGLSTRDVEALLMVSLRCCFAAPLRHMWHDLHRSFAGDALHNASGVAQFKLRSRSPSEPLTPTSATTDVRDKRQRHKARQCDRESDGHAVTHILPSPPNGMAQPGVSGLPPLKATASPTTIAGVAEADEHAAAQTSRDKSGPGAAAATADAVPPPPPPPSLHSDAAHHGGVARASRIFEPHQLPAQRRLWVHVMHKLAAMLDRERWDTTRLRLLTEAIALALLFAPHVLGPEDGELQRRLADLSGAQATADSGQGSNTEPQTPSRPGGIVSSGVFRSPPATSDSLSGSPAVVDIAARQAKLEDQRFLQRELNASLRGVDRDAVGGMQQRQVKGGHGGEANAGGEEVGLDMHEGINGPSTSDGSHAFDGAEESVPTQLARTRTIDCGPQPARAAVVSPTQLPSPRSVTRRRHSRLRLPVESPTDPLDIGRMCLVAMSDAMQQALSPSCFQQLTQAYVAHETRARRHSLAESSSAGDGAVSADMAALQQQLQLQSSALSASVATSPLSVASTPNDSALLSTNSRSPIGWGAMQQAGATLSGATDADVIEGAAVGVDTSAAAMIGTDASSGKSAAGSGGGGLGGSLLLASSSMSSSSGAMPYPLRRAATTSAMALFARTETPVDQDTPVGLSGSGLPSRTVLSGPLTSEMVADFDDDWDDWDDDSDDNEDRIDDATTEAVLFAAHALRELFAFAASPESADREFQTHALQQRFSELDWEDEQNATALASMWHQAHQTLDWS